MAAADPFEQTRGEAERLDSYRRELTRAISAIQKEYYGKGPDFARSYANDDTVVVLMRGGYTKAEETLVNAGRGEAVFRQRRAFQEVMRERFEEEVLRIVGRKVIAFMSSSHQDPDFHAEIFVLDSLEEEING